MKKLNEIPIRCFLCGKEGIVEEWNYSDMVTNPEGWIVYVYPWMTSEYKWKRYIPKELQREILCNECQEKMKEKKE